MNFFSCKHLKLTLLLSPLCFMVIGCDEPGFQLGAADPVEIKITKTKNLKHKKPKKKTNFVPIDSSLSKLILPQSNNSSNSEEILELRNKMNRLIKNQLEERKKISKSLESSEKGFIEYKKEAEKSGKKQLTEISILKRQNKILLSEIDKIKKEFNKILLDKNQKKTIVLKRSLDKKSKSQVFLVGEPKDKKLDPVGKSLQFKQQNYAIPKKNISKILKPEKKITKVELDYNNALRLYRYGKDLKSSRVLFENFLNKYPNHFLSDDAQFWIAKTFYLEKDFEQAILAFSKLQVDYPKGNMVPDSIYYEGMSYLNFGDRASAKELLKRLIEIFPSADASKKAKEKLKSL